MRDYDDSIRLYTPVFQRIIILVGVVIAVPLVMWTITAFIRTNVERPRAPVYAPTAMNTPVAHRRLARSPRRNRQPQARASLCAQANAQPAAQPASQSVAPTSAQMADAATTATDARVPLLAIRKPTAADQPPAAVAAATSAAALQPSVSAAPTAPPAFPAAPAGGRPDASGGASDRSAGCREQDGETRFERRARECKPVARFAAWRPDERPRSDAEQPSSARSGGRAGIDRCRRRRSAGARSDQGPGPASAQPSKPCGGGAERRDRHACGARHVRGPLAAGATVGRA